MSSNNFDLVMNHPRSFIFKQVWKKLFSSRISSLEILRFLCLPVFFIFLPNMANAVHVPHLAPYGKASCYIMGDSLAVGIAQQLPQCWSNTKVGLNTKQAVQRFIQNPRTYLAIISLGVNDNGTRLPTLQNLTFIRRNVQSNKVIWILPNKASRRNDILLVASLFQDQVIDMTKPNLQKYVSSKDHIHPSGTGYAVMAIEAQDMAW